MEKKDWIKKIFELSRELKKDGFADAAFICQLSAMTLLMHPQADVKDDIEKLYKKWAARSRAACENEGLFDESEIKQASDFSN